MNQAGCGHAHSDPERYIRKGDKAYCPKCGKWLGNYGTRPKSKSKAEAMGYGNSD